MIQQRQRKSIGHPKSIAIELFGWKAYTTMTRVYEAYWSVRLSVHGKTNTKIITLFESDDYSKALEKYEMYKSLTE